MMALLWRRETCKKEFEERIPNMQDRCWRGKRDIPRNCDVLVYIFKG
uniref:Uncharacterized protein n=1 Tax=Arundo donax TaxID=35708 RepID=A0A0A8ZVP3_ARUDO